MTERYLSVVGALPMFVERIIVSDVSELASVEADIREAVAELATSADAKTFERPQRLQATREELSSMEPTRRSEMVATGQTMAEYWHGALVDDRREMLADAFDEIIIRPGRRGYKTVDPDRIETVWRRENDLGDAYR
nr:hypothetical protein OH820_30395 [Streptomyces sp. NBC_00857]